MSISVQALEKLEFHQVRNALAERTATSMGRERALQLVPSRNAREIVVLLDEIEDALFGVLPNLGGITDIRPIVHAISEGRLLEGSSLLEIAYTLDAAMTLKRGIAGHSKGALLNVAGRIGTHVVLVRSVLERLERDGSVRNTATPKLNTIRRRLNPLREEIRSRLSGIMDRHTDALQDRLITVRRERYVIPVRTSHEREVPGIVVDASNSQQTLFIEPAGVVPLNNELAKLLIEEEEEVKRILLELAQMVSSEPALDETLDAVAHLDLVAAKAKLAREWGLIRPEQQARDYEFQGLRHPLIPNCVANDLTLTSNQRLLLITGPNMGGKTATLKSTGLACLMHQAGLYVCAKQAKLPVLENILIDLGDEQSLAANLSTFAAHLANLGRILEQASPQTLVLIDELGSGTDPAEGAALSQAILEGLLDRGACGIVTSHLAPLKAFAIDRADVVNASMSFDLVELAPTYHLNIGHPGRSYALAIARRLGFPVTTLGRAEEILGPEGLNVEQLLAHLEQERAKLEAARTAAEHERERAMQKARIAQGELERLEQERENILLEAQARADNLYREALEHIRTLRTRAREESERPKVLGELSALRSALVTERPQPQTQREVDLKPGVSVEVPAYGTSGTVLEVRGEQVIVQLGLLKMNLKRRDLKVKRPAGIGAKIAATTSTSTFAKELNLRGTHIDEALEEVRDFLTEAHAMRESTVRILHGKGTGVLRRAIRDYLKNDRRVESFHDAQPYEGGHGVTVAHLRNQ